MATNEELITLINDGISVKSNMYQLYNQNITLLNKWCKRYFSIFGKEDTLQECYIALHTAVKSFDVEKEYKFTTYLQKAVQTHFIRMLAINKGFKIGKNDKKLLVKYQSLKEKELKTNGNRLTDSKACCLLGCSDDDLKRIKQYFDLLHPVSMDAPINDDEENGSLGDIISSDTDIMENYEDKAMQSYYATELWDKVHSICTETEENVLLLRYKNNLTRKQVGNINGFSGERARQYEVKAFSKLKRNKDIKALAKEICNFSDISYKYGFSSWVNNRVSSVELALELLEKQIMQSNNN